MDNNWRFMALTEGLRGWETSVFIFNNLILAVNKQLADMYEHHFGKSKSEEELEPSSSKKATLPSEKIDAAVLNAFLDVDRGVVFQARDMIFSSPSKSLNMVPHSAAMAGSTALLACYD